MGEGRGTPELRLPRFTAEVDCGPIGYPGLEVWFWLNITFDPDRISDEDWAKRAKQAEEAGQAMPARPPWDSDYYYGLGRIIERVEFPGEYTATSEAVTVPIGGGEALYNLMGTAGFDQQIVLWASTQYYNLRTQRLRDAEKN